LRSSPIVSSGFPHPHDMHISASCDRLRLVYPRLGESNRSQILVSSDHGTRALDLRQSCDIDIGVENTDGNW
jgi:hypothetical protein